MRRDSVREEQLSLQLTDYINGELVSYLLLRRVSTGMLSSCQSTWAKMAIPRPTVAMSHTRVSPARSLFIRALLQPWRSEARRACRGDEANVLLNSSHDSALAQCSPPRARTTMAAPSTWPRSYGLAPRLAHPFLRTSPVVDEVRSLAAGALRRRYASPRA